MRKRNEEKDIFFVIRQKILINNISLPTVSQGRLSLSSAHVDQEHGHHLCHI